MEFSKEIIELGDQIAALKPATASELLAYMKDVYGIEPAFVQKKQQEKRHEQQEKPPEQTEWSVLITSYEPNNKVGLVKLYRELSGKGLKESMDAIVATTNGVPLIVKEGMPKTEAEKLKVQLEAASAKVVLK